MRKKIFYQREKKKASLQSSWGTALEILLRPPNAPLSLAQAHMLLPPLLICHFIHLIIVLYMNVG